MHAIEREEYKGCTIRLFVDEDPQSPREDDNVGEILYTSTRYNLGDRRSTREEMDRIVESSDNIYLPVYAYIHSGTRLNTTGFSCPWDSGQCGIIWCTKERAVKEWGNKRFTKTVQDKALKCLACEIETLDQYFNGEIVGFTVEDPDGEDIDSCWGFYPDESDKLGRYNYPLSQARSAVDHWAEKRAQQAEQHLALL